MEFFDDMKDQIMQKTLENAAEKRMEDLREKEGDSSLGKAMSMLENSGLGVKDCMQAAEGMNIGVSDIMDKAKEIGLEPTDCLQLFAGASKGNTGNMVDTIKSAIGGGQQEDRGFNFGSLLQPKDNEKDGGDMMDALKNVIGSQGQARDGDKEDDGVNIGNIASFF